MSNSIKPWMVLKKILLKHPEIHIKYYHTSTCDDAPAHTLKLSNHKRKVVYVQYINDINLKLYADKVGQTYSRVGFVFHELGHAYDVVEYDDGYEGIDPDETVANYVELAILSISLTKAELCALLKRGIRVELSMRKSLIDIAKKLIRHILLDRELANEAFKFFKDLPNYQKPNKVYKRKRK